MKDDTIRLTLSNVPRQHEPGKRVIGFSIDKDELQGELGASRAS